MHIRTARKLIVLLAVMVGMTLTTAFAQSEIRIAIPTDLESLDPHERPDMTPIGVLVNVFDTLTTFDQDLQLVASLATSWRTVEPTIWEFTLRDDVTFHNGEPFNAAAVKYSLDRLNDPVAPKPAAELRNITEVEIVDDYTVRIHTDGPDPNVARKLTLFPGVIVPPAYLEEVGDAVFAERPVGTGPYQVVSWQRGGEIVLEAFDGYWGGRAPIDRVVVVAIPNAASRVTALLAGDVDIALGIQPDAVETIEASSVADAVSVPGLRLHFLSLDPRDNSALGDVRVRRAIAHALDVDLLIEAILEGNGYRENSFLSSAVFGHDASLARYAYDPARARELLEEAGYAGGFDLTVHAPSGLYMKDREVAIAVAGMLREVGIDAQAESLESGAWNELLRGDGLSPVYFVGSLAWTLDGSPAIGYYFGDGAVFSRTSNARLDELLEVQATEVDEATRTEYLTELQRLIHDEVYAIPLWRTNDIYGVSTRIDWEPPQTLVTHYNQIQLR